MQVFLTKWYVGLDQETRLTAHLAYTGASLLIKIDFFIIKGKHKLLIIFGAMVYI